MVLDTCKEWKLPGKLPIYRPEEKVTIKFKPPRTVHMNSSLLNTASLSNNYSSNGNGGLLSEELTMGSNNGGTTTTCNKSNNNSYCHIDAGKLHQSSAEVGHSLQETVGQQLYNETDEVRWPSLTGTVVAAPVPHSIGIPSLLDHKLIPDTEVVNKIREIKYPEPNAFESSPPPTDFPPEDDDNMNLMDLNTSLPGLELNSNPPEVSISQAPVLMELTRSLSNDSSPSINPHVLCVQKEAAFRDFDLSCTAQEIAKVLETFNAILDNEDFEDTTNLSLNPSDPESVDCLRIVDNFTDLLTCGDGSEEDLLIVVDDSSYDSSQNTLSNLERHVEKDKTPVFVLDEDDEGLELEYPDVEDIEGYESDRPMVRASMRKLRPVQMLPMPQSVMPNSSYTIPECPSPSAGDSSSGSPVPGSSGLPPPGLATTLHSPITNRILVTSLINNITRNSPDDALHSQSVTLGASDVDLENFYDAHLAQCTIISEVSNPLYEEIISVPGGNNRNEANQDPSSPLYRANIPSVSIPPGSPSSTGQFSSPENSSNNSPRNSVSRSHDVEEIGNGLGTVPNPLQNNNAHTVTSPNTTASDSSQSGIGRATGRTSSFLGPGLRMPSGRWPHRLSSVLALVSCTLGLNTICRFSLLSVEYGANFIVQFLILSLVFGIPLFTFHMSLGQYLSSGIIDMWRISPIFQGIGIGLMVSQAMIGIYSAVGVSWVFIYFRDSFITRYDQYRWGQCLREYRGSACDFTGNNNTNFAESIPDYFNGVVLQRASPDYPSSAALSSSLKFTVAFNLAVVWMLIFVSLSKGLKSYGKVVHGFVLVPVATLLVLASKMIGLVPTDQGESTYINTEWKNFFYNSQTWIVAAREAFFTWGLLGACVMQVTSHNRFTHSLKSDASIVVLITTFVLLICGCLGNFCYAVILSHNLEYVPSSFESQKTFQFLKPTSPDTPSADPFANQHISFLMGVRILTPEMMNGKTSGYQSLRLVTELFPATMTLLGNTGVSPFWTVLFYFTCLMFGIAQQIAIWHSVIRGVIAIRSKVLQSWEITITFCVCAGGFLLGLPFCTEVGIFIEYFMDYAIGSGWWIMVLYLLELVAVFIVRGAPYCGENIVTVLITGPGKLMAILAPLVSFVWNVILPVAMLVLSIASFKSGNIRELYDWNPNHGYEFWPSWTKELGSLIQLLPILAVPFVAIIQSCRYLTNGPPDLFERMQQLYRPTSRGLFGRNVPTHLSGNTPTSDFPNPSNGTTRSGEDPPPKYTPPPSYSTATGAKIAKFLRSSFRRSMRRLGGGPSSSTTSAELPPPPNYASVILEINAQQLAACNNSSITRTNPVQINSLAPIIVTPNDHNLPIPNIQGTAKKSLTLGRTLGESKERSSLRRIASDITPRDIARLLRANFRRGTGSDDRIKNNHSNQNNLNYDFPTNSQVHRSTSSTPTKLNIHQDFLRVPMPSAHERLPYNLNPAVNSSFEINSSRLANTTEQMLNPADLLSRQHNNHMRSSSSSGTLMAAASHRRGRSDTTDSQITLISHSSSQNDLSRLTDTPGGSFTLGGIVNPSFEFSQQSLQQPRVSFNHSEA
ncbi:unnamed protein product [Allacma fusca]|uniref:Uncharacterized protein n=1 Tax=Allacma fusca TaxID=39272 RepID=A0A8J2NR04_9HEXA|nr:unnamed protein product [Allacma fusca]